MYKIGIIGGGNMGEAIIKGCRKHFFVRVSEKDLKRQTYLARKYRLASADIKAVVRSSKVVIIAVKPQDMDDVLKTLKAVDLKDKLIISIAAGITTGFIERKIGKKPKVVRTMPNMPALIAEGITAICKGHFAHHDDVQLSRKIFDCIGRTVVVDEKLMDSITAVSGSGPAYVYFFMECLIKAAQSLGLKEVLAKDLVENTFLGSIHLLLKEKADPACLRAKVTSKGGTTQAALEVLMRKKFGLTIKQALKAAQKRAKALARR